MDIRYPYYLATLGKHHVKGVDLENRRIDLTLDKSTQTKLDGAQAKFLLSSTQCEVIKVSQSNVFGDSAEVWEDITDPNDILIH